MMIRKREILFGIILSLVLPCVGQHTVSGVPTDDTMYRRVIQNGQDSLSCYLAYAPGSHEVLPDFSRNADELKRLDKFIHRAFADTLIYVREVLLTGYCSIDGPYAVNEQLAKDRVISMKNYLDAHYGLSSRYYVDLAYMPEDWTTLRQMISVSFFPWRNEALAIIDHTDIFEGREAQLMKLDGGTPYREMREAFFHQLRRVEVKVIYDLKRIIEQRYQRKMSDAEYHEVLEWERKEKQSTQAAEVTRWEGEPWIKNMNRERIRLERMQFQPVLGIKTNLISWAGVTPELERTTFMPNLAAEVFFARRFSTELSATYADFDFGIKEHWGVTAYSLEPRVWLKGNRRYTGLYFGIYGQMGDFNVQRSKGNYTGTYLQGGISAGYFLPITKHLGVEFGVRGGYHKADAKQYEIRWEHLYQRENKVSADRIGLMGLNVSVSYRL